MTNRTEVIQRTINANRAIHYLEIGVNNGVNFLKIRAPRKVGVDPKFCATPQRKVSWYLRNPSNWFSRWIEKTSDDYFEIEGAHAPIDVAFVDGLHTYKQSLKDTLNALDRLQEGGVIILHDCNPPNQYAATPALSLEDAGTKIPPGSTEAWCGDVWKTIIFLRSFHPDLRVFVLDCDFGLGVVMKGANEGLLSYTREQIDALTYSDLEKDKKRLLNLKPATYLSEFLKR